MRLLRLIPLCWLLIGGLPLTSVSAELRPNIILILADDLGYGDLPAYGAKDVRVPNLDKLATEGVRFTQAYSNGPECTPSRAAILTGRHPQRPGGMECPVGTGNVGRYDDAIRLRAQNDLGLPPPMASLAPGLKSVGYRTAIFGKWHMGYEPKFNPLDQGFDHFLGILGGNVDYYEHVELSELPVFYEDRNPVKREGYLTDLIRDEGSAWLRSQKPEVPFFLFLSFTAPHFPFRPPGVEAQPLPTAEEWTKGTRANYVAMIESLDSAIGKILSTLDETGAAMNTLVVFASDNGAMLPGSNAPFRDAKETLFEGGIRVPVIMRWPGKIRAGQINEQPWMLMDLTASFLAIADANPPGGRALDGYPILVDLRRGQKWPDRDFFWRARRGNRTWRAIRSGDLKWVQRDDAGEGKEEWLFDLSKDPGETMDLKPTRTEDAKRLFERVKSWELEVQSER